MFVQQLSITFHHYTLGDVYVYACVYVYSYACLVLLVFSGVLDCCYYFLFAPMPPHPSIYVSIQPAISPQPSIASVSRFICNIRNSRLAD